MSKTNPKIKSLQTKPSSVSEEELKAQQIRALHQQRCSMVQIFASNICNGTPFGPLQVKGAEEIANFCGELADRLMDQFYGKKEEEEK